MNRNVNIDFCFFVAPSLTYDYNYLNTQHLSLRKTPSPHSSQALDSSLPQIRDAVASITRHDGWIGEEIVVRGVQIPEVGQKVKRFKWFL